MSGLILHLFVKFCFVFLGSLHYFSIRLVLNESLTEDTFFPLLRLIMKYKK